jgi:hypothetical protein
MKLLLVDVEASSLGPASWPVEIGWLPFDAETGEDAGELESYLIRPQPEWVSWDSDSERFHRISRAVLASDGLPAIEAGRRFLDALARADSRYITDSFADSAWISTLLGVSGAWAEWRHFSAALSETTGVPPPQLRDLLRSLPIHFNREHRARSDVRYLQLRWQLVLESCGMIPGPVPIELRL